LSARVEKEGLDKKRVAVRSKAEVREKKVRTQWQTKKAGVWEETRVGG